MKETQILSVFHDSADPMPEPARPEANGWVFDTCHVGVVLRAVLLVQAVLALSAMFVATSPMDWLARLSVFTAGALPATLLWLLTTCGLKRWTGLWFERLQQTFAVFLGALAGLYGCGVLLMLGLLAPAPWVASAFAGAGFAAALVLTLAVRATHVAPAAAAARLAELQARIRPHFLFNTLNSAIALVRAEPLKAEQLLEDLSELFRHALSAHGESVTLGEEIALAQRYLAIEQVRFGERIRVEWALDPVANQARLPPLLLQPLVENAVKHGVEPSDAGAEIKVSTHKRGSRVIVKVTNTTPVPSQTHGSGLALDNVRQRLALLHDVQAKFQTGVKDGVFQVRLELPYES